MLLTHNFAGLDTFSNNSAINTKQVINLNLHKFDVENFIILSYAIDNISPSPVSAAEASHTCMSAE